MNGYWNEKDADRLPAMSSKDYLANQLIKTYNENVRLRGSLSNARTIIGILAVVALLFILVAIADPVDIGGPMVSDDYHGQPIGPFQ